MNIVVRLLAGLLLLLGISILTAWAWDRSDALSAPTPATVVEHKAAG